MKDMFPNECFIKQQQRRTLRVFIVWEVVLDSLWLFPEESVEKKMFRYQVLSQNAL